MCYFLEKKKKMTCDFCAFSLFTAASSSSLRGVRFWFISVKCLYVSFFPAGLVLGRERILCMTHSTHNFSRRRGRITFRERGRAERIWTCDFFMKKIFFFFFVSLQIFSEFFVFFFDIGVDDDSHTEQFFHYVRSFSRIVTKEYVITNFFPSFLFFSYNMLHICHQ